MSDTNKLREAHCPVCGYYCLGKGGYGCIDKPAALAASKPEPQQCPVCEGSPAHDNNPCSLCGTQSNRFTVSSKPERQSLTIPCLGQPLEGKPEPQAQAAEPEVVAIADDLRSNRVRLLRPLPLGAELITLKSHRAAMATQRNSYTKTFGAEINSLSKEFSEAIANKDAALGVCVEALKQAREDIEHWAGYASDYFRNKHDVQADLDDVDAAIQQAREARK